MKVTPKPFSDILQSYPLLYMHPTTHFSAAVPSDPQVRTLVEDTVAALGSSSSRATAAAGHDSAKAMEAIQVGGPMSIRIHNGKLCLQVRL